MPTALHQHLHNTEIIYHGKHISPTHHEPLWLPMRMIIVGAVVTDVVVGHAFIRGIGIPFHEKIHVSVKFLFTVRSSTICYKTMLLNLRGTKVDSLESIDFVLGGDPRERFLLAKKLQH